MTRQRQRSLKKRSPRKSRQSTLFETLELRTLLSVTSITVNAINPTEGVPFGSSASPAQIGTFDVNNYIGIDESSQYSAVINWGDGSQSAGLGPVTIQFVADLGNGDAEYGVYSYHTYAEATTTANPDTLTINIADNTGPGTLQSQSGPVQVNDAPLTLGTEPAKIAATAGGPLTNLSLGTFIDQNPLAQATDYAVQVNWGDSATTAGTVLPYSTAVQSGGTSVSFAVEASHTYTTPGTYTVTTTVNDNEGSSVVLTTTIDVAGAALVPTANPIVVTEGPTIAAGIAVGTFTDLGGPQPVGNYTASVLFPGATAPTPLTVTQNGSGNTYTLATKTATDFTAGSIDEGLYNYTLTVSDTGGATATTTGTLTVKDAPLSVVSTPSISATEGTPLTNQQVLVFQDANTAATTTDFTASINWGDGTAPSIGTIVSLGGGEFSVTGDHTYATAAGSPFTVTTTVLDKGGSSVTGQATATVTGAAIKSGTGIPVYGTEGQNLIGVPVATFISDNPLATATGFSATITWGNGNTTPGVITQVGSTATTSEFEVTGSNIYLSVSGSPFAIAVNVSSTSGSTLPTIATTATITQTPISVSVFPVSAKAGAPTPANLLVGTFTDTGGADPLADYSVTVNWGDGSSNTTATGVVITPVGGNTYNITAPTHTYSTPGFYVLVVSVTDTDPATGTGAGPVVVSPATLSASAAGGSPISAQEGQPLTNVIVATFTSSDPTALKTDFTASINWGDGQTSVGTITQPGGPGTTFDVLGSHTYAFDGSYVVTTTISGEGSTATATTTATITEAPITVGSPPLTIAGYQNTPLSNVDVATFTSPDPFETAVTFVATINWGDGTPATAGSIVEDASGVFHVEGNHTYITSGKFFPTITIAEQDSPTVVMGTANPTVNISATPLLVTATPVNAVEGIALPNAQNATNGTVVATFTDSVAAVPIGDFTATINFGNGQTTPGTIISSGGSNFQVVIPTNPVITYSEEGLYTFTVTVTDTDATSSSGFFTAFAYGTATVKDAPLTADPSQPTVTGIQQSPLIGVPVSKFTDANPTAPLSDFSVTIDWGDGTPQSAGHITQPGGVGTAFIVLGNHTYAQPSTTPYPITVHIQDIGGSSLVTTTFASIAASTITGTAVTISGTEGTPISNAVVAYFSDSGIAGPLSSYSATIAAPGSTSSTTIGTIIPLGGNEFAVEGSFTYPQDGTYGITVTIDHNGVPAAIVVSTAVIADAPIAGSAVPVYATEGEPFTGDVAVFLDSNPFGVASDFTATINWGNGASSSGTVVANGTSFIVTAVDPVSHNGYAFPEEGTYTFSVTVKDVGGAQFTAFQTATVADAPLTATGLTLGVAPNPIIYTYPEFSGEVASFTDADPNGMLSDYSATINWGDGKVTPGTITMSPTISGLFLVSGTHQFAQSSVPYQATITIKDVGGSTATALTSITVSDTLLTAGSPTAITGTEAKAFTVQVGTFTDADPAAVPAQYSSTINWGDGTPTSSGVIGKLANGTFTVTGSHTYAEESPPGDPYAITITITDIAGTAPGTTTDTATATIADAPLTSLGSPITGIEGIGLSPSPITVATFTDADPNGTVSDYTAIINWGDGTATTVGTITQTGTSPNGSTFNVSGAHTYTEEGDYQTTVTITDAGGSQTVAVGNAVIADAPLSPAATQPTVATTESPIYPVPVFGNPIFSGPVVTFTDANPVPPTGSSSAADFTATINWGDGTAPTLGTIVQLGGVSTYDVDGSHTYASTGTGTYTITVNIVDTGGSRLTVTNTATVAPVPYNVTGSVSPSSLTGKAGTTDLTSITQPTFTGTSAPFSNITLFATPVGSTLSTIIGRTEAGSDGSWSITSSYLATGQYVITASATDQFGLNPVGPFTITPVLTIDTAPPVITALSFDRFDATLTVTFQNSIGGMNLQSITNSAFYHISATPLASYVHVPKLILPTQIYYTPGALPSDPVTVEVVFNKGHVFRGGRYEVVIDSGNGSTGIDSAAGVALSGNFYGSFPTGDGVPGGNFVAAIYTFHDKVLPFVPIASGYSPPAAGIDPPAGTKLPRAKRNTIVHQTEPLVASAAASRMASLNAKLKAVDAALSELVISTKGKKKS
jgi:hypothetical protein